MRLTSGVIDSRDGIDERSDVGIVGVAVLESKVWHGKFWPSISETSCEWHSYFQHEAKNGLAARLGRMNKMYLQNQIHR